MNHLKPNDVFSRRLRQARKMRGLSLRKLSDKLNRLVSYNALNKYEKGEMFPGSKVLLGLAEALEVKPSFFFRSFDVDIQKVSFRKRTKLGKKEERTILEEARDYFERYLELEEILGIRKEFTNPLQKQNVRTLEEAEAAAKELRDQWCLGRDAIPNVSELLEEHEVKLYEASTQNHAFDGFCGVADGNCVVVLGSWLKNHPARKRMTLIHELAHIIMSVDLPEREEEKVVNRFAGAFLFPDDAVKEYFGSQRTQVSLQELIEIKALFGISIMAIVVRANQLGYVSDQNCKYFFMNANRHHWREGEPGDERVCGCEGSNRFRTLVYRALSEERISTTKAAELLNTSVSDIRNNFSIVV